jgi:hypothetical protein
MDDEVLRTLLVAWITFRRSHDLESLELKCCEKSANLFEALRAYESLMTGEKK